MDKRMLKAMPELHQPGDANSQPFKKYTTGAVGQIHKNNY
jgi:hypothetical protein